MGLRSVYEKLDDIEEKYRDLYKEKDGKYVIDTIDGLYPETEVKRLRTENSNFRVKNKEVTEKLAKLGERDIDEVLAELDKIEEYKTAASSKSEDKTKLVSELSELKVTHSKVSKEFNKAQERLSALEKENQALKHARDTAFLHDAIRAAALDAKVLEGAVEDALVLAERMFEVVHDPETGQPVEVRTKDGVGVTPGDSPKDWFGEIQPKRSHWWGPSQGTGSRGNGSGNSVTVNPYKRKSFNPDAQAELYRKDPELARRLAAEAGSIPMGTMPPPDRE